MTPTARTEEPMGVSQWKEYGEKYGYWKYFEEQARLSRERETACEIVKFLDELEMKQPDDLKTDNWRNWKYIRNSIVDRYDILDKLRTEEL